MQEYLGCRFSLWITQQIAKLSFPQHKLKPLSGFHWCVNHTSMLMDFTEYVFMWRDTRLLLYYMKEMTYTWGNSIASVEFYVYLNSE